MTRRRITVFAASFLTILAAGCGMFSRPTAAAAPETRAEEVRREEAALDLIEKKITPPADTKTAEPQQKTTDPPAAAAPDQQRDAIGDAILKYADWLYFAAYCGLALIMAWYVKKTGQQNETLQKISDTVSGRLTFKHRMLFRILRFIYRKKKKKQEEKK